MIRKLTNEQLEAAGPWLHDFDLPAPLKVPLSEDLRQRIRLRRNHIVSPILAQYARGALDGLSVLDLGANAGFWARELSARGAKVTCVEPRAENIAQAELVAEVLGAADLLWVQATAEDFLRDSSDRFDIVLCLGLAYHTPNTIDLVQSAMRQARDLFVLDSHCINDDAAYLELRRENAEHFSQGVDSIITLPSRGALFRILREVSFASVAEAPNVGDLPPDYLAHRRCTFFARREQSFLRPVVAGVHWKVDAELDAVYGDLPVAASLGRSPSRPRG